MQQRLNAFLTPLSLNSLLLACLCLTTLSSQAVTDSQTESPITSNTAPTPNWQQPTYILKAFAEIALKNEYRQTQHRILKWQSPIFYSFSYHGLKKNALIESLFTQHLTHLQEITGLSIQPINANHTHANLHIHLTKDSQYQQVITTAAQSHVKGIARDSNCMGSFKRNRQHAIADGVIVIPVDHVFSKGLLVACIVEETTQLLGLPNDSDWVNPSIANDVSKIELLTGLDYLLLKMLYSPKIKAGMSQQKSLKILKSELLKFKKSGIIKRAQYLVNQSGLNAYLK
ncbi:MAG: DUF2927 domain-containing protein [Gammaproteobacteria bacterium]|nr:DUF2927 domain-containing protein [Gammaproteobacteria bacterium]